MKKATRLYTLTTDDVRRVSGEIGISFSPKDVPMIQERIGDYFGSQWYDAVEYALTRLKSEKKRENNMQRTNQPLTIIIATLGRQNGMRGCGAVPYNIAPFPFL